MNTGSQENTSTPVSDDDLPGFYDVFSAFWQGKWIVVAFIVVGLLGSLVFLGVAKPRYRAVVTVVPSLQTQLNDYNRTLLLLDKIVHGPNARKMPDWLGFIISAFTEGRDNGVNVMSEVLSWKELTPAAAFEIFEQQLRATKTSDLFLQGLAQSPEGKGLSESERVAITQRFDVRSYAQRGIPKVDVLLWYTDPELAARWVNTFVNLALEQSRAEMLVLLQDAVANELAVNTQYLDLLRQAASHEGAPARSAGQSAVTAATDPLLVEPSSGRLEMLQAQIDWLSKMTVQSLEGDLAFVATPATAAAAPYFPNRIVVVAVGIAIGLVLGFLVILGRLSVGYFRKMRPIAR